MKTVTAIIALTLLLLKVIAVAGPRVWPAPARVDTVRVETTVYDTVTVISRAADTVRIRIKDIGPLTVQDLVRIICGRELSYGDNRDDFRSNAYGMIFCPRGNDE